VDTIAKRVKGTRLELGWSQVQLAEAVGVSQSTIGNIESGFRQRPRELVSIAKALRVSPGWLETGTGEQEEAAAVAAENGPPSVRALVEQLAAIARKQRPTMRKNLANLLVDVATQPDDAELIEQTILDIERLFQGHK